MPSRAAARRAVLEGKVAVEGLDAPRPSSPVDPDTVVRVDPSATRFVGRGGHKLEAALDAFEIGVAGRTAVDVGASTGGFTDCLLQRGARSVLAVDVGSDQLHPDLRSDPRVTSLEQTDVRNVAAEQAGGPFEVVVVDVSFVSLEVVAEAVVSLGAAEADWIVLVKPQFETGPGGRSRRGVVRDEAAREQAVEAAVDVFAVHGLVRCGVMPSPVVGGAGNVEYLAWLRRPAGVADVTVTDDDGADG